ncbi:MAG: hypothetical protein ACK449_12405 [Planctomycetota bacterium]
MVLLAVKNRTAHGRSWTLMGTAKSGAAGGQEPDRSWTLMDADGNSQE